MKIDIAYCAPKVPGVSEATGDCSSLTSHAKNQSAVRAVLQGTRPYPGSKTTFENEDGSGLAFLLLDTAMEKLPGARLQQPLYVLQASEAADFVFRGPGMLIQLPKWSVHISEQHFVCSEHKWNCQVNTLI